MSGEPTTIAVVIPIGPERHHAEYLDECIASIEAQDYPRVVIQFVDDMHGSVWRFAPKVPHETYRPPWRLGPAGAWNAGIATALTHDFQFEGPEWHRPELALMMGADDWLEPGALSALEAAYHRNDRADGFYWFAIRYTDDRPDPEQALPCNFAAVTLPFWQRTGGFSPEMGAGQMDAAFVSAMLVHAPASLIRVPGGPWCNVRVHERQYGKAPPPNMTALRDWITVNYKPADWGRYT